MDAVVESIRALIEAQTLKIGDGLPTERDLASQLGVSRNTVREAIKRLEAFGVIETKQKKGARIVDKSIDAIVKIMSFRLQSDPKVFHDVQRFRAVIESEFVPDIIQRATKPKIRELREINDRLRTTFDLHTLARIDLDFHLKFLALAGNETAIKVYDMLSSVILQIMTLGKAQNGVELAATSHSAMVDALEQRDEAALKLRIASHMAVGARFLSAMPPTGAEAPTVCKLVPKAPAPRRARGATARKGTITSLKEPEA